MPETTRFRPNSPPVLHETIDRETIIVNLEIGTYYSLNPSATSIWTGLESGASLAAIAAALADCSGAEPERIDGEVRAFVQKLAAAELVVEGQGGIEPDELDLDWPEGAPFDSPALSTYTDMQELLLLDPVHDVGVGGWPQRP